MEEFQLSGALTLQDGLELDINVTIRDPHDAARDIAQDIMDMFAAYQDDLDGVGGCEDVQSHELHAQLHNELIEQLKANMRAAGLEVR